MTTDELFTINEQPAAETLADQTTDTSKLSGDEWYAYWDAHGLTHSFSLHFRHHTAPSGSFDRMYPQKDIDRFVSQFEQLVDIVTEHCSDVRVTKDQKNSRLTFDVLFEPGRPADVIPFLIRLWILSGHFSSGHWSPAVCHLFRRDSGSFFVEVTGLRMLCATLDAMRHNVHDRGARSDVTENDCLNFTKTLMQTSLYPDGTTAGEIAHLLMEHIRKSLNLRTKETGEEYSPEWTSFIVGHITKQMKTKQ